MASMPWDIFSIRFSQTSALDSGRPFRVAGRKGMWGKSRELILWSHRDNRGGRKTEAKEAIEGLQSSRQEGKVADS